MKLFIHKLKIRIQKIKCFFGIHQWDFISGNLCVECLIHRQELNPSASPRMYKYLDSGKQKHWHEIDGKQLIGTTAVVGVIAKNLTWWAAETAAVECLEAGEKIPTIREEYLEAKKRGKEGIDALQVKYPIFKTARYAHFADKNDKAKKGTDLHAELEDFVKGKMGLIPTREYDKKIQPFIDWTEQNVDRFFYSEAHCYSERLWVGGISDCGFIDKQGKVGIIDFKSAKEAYISMFIQIAGYDIQFQENGGFDENGKKIWDYIPVDYYAVLPFGAEKPEVVKNYDTESLRQAFEAAVVLYKIVGEK